MIVLNAWAGMAQAQVSTIPASSELYNRIEAISAFAPTRSVFLGERPLSAREMRRLVARIRMRADSLSSNQANQRADWTRREIDALTHLLSDTQPEAGTRVRFAADQELWSSSSTSERFTSNGLGTIDAFTNPFEMRRAGTPVGNGPAMQLALTAALDASEHFAIVAEPRYAVVTRSERADGWFLHRAYARGQWKNIAVAAGRDELHWGQSPIAALFFSENSQPFPFVSLGTDTSVTLPWLLRLAGPVRFTIVLADLGASQDPPHARLAGWQGSFQPWTRLEAGVAVLAQTGGNGAPRATFLTRLIDLFPGLNAVSSNLSNAQISNKLAGGNLRLRIPEWSNLDVYYEMQIDDFDGRRLKSSFVDDAAHLLGLRLPLLVQGDLLSLRAELHRTSIRLYEHTQFRSGVTYREKIIGDPLGPHAVGAYLSGEWRTTPQKAVSLTLADERRDPSQYATTVSGTRDRGFKFVRLTNDPDIRRRRALAGIVPGWLGGRVQGSVGINQSWRTGTAKRTEWFALLSLSTRAQKTF